MANFFAHSSSFIDEDVHIGTDTKIWHFSHILTNSNIGSNCSFGQNCVVGPNVSVGSGTIIIDSIVKNSIIQEGSDISAAILSDSMIGNKAKVTGSTKDLSIGDFCEITI